MPIWVNAPRATHHQVWAEFANDGGWGSIGLAVLVGQLAGIAQQTGIDTVSWTTRASHDSPLNRA